MATYIIGDVQGSYQELMQLLERIDYKPQTDRLGFVGDVVNRGPESLAVLRYIKSLDSPIVVLGNHDFYLLILGYEIMPIDSYPHTLHDIIKAPDRYELLDWLRQQPLMTVNEDQQAAFVHAGLPPQWSIKEGMSHANEVADALRGPHFIEFLSTLFGDTPQKWTSSLKGQDRLRYITNAFTRMRFCKKTGELDFTKELPDQNNDPSLRPWFDWRDPKEDFHTVCFGHWAALGGQCDMENYYALDTGCAWGHSLTALRLEDKKRFSVPSTLT
jgi:bis(5'-nucleosyl)-tetraphosphatase (symmetrical)